ncbi:MAG: hypothetical protein AAF416_18835 [Pseudomonadota bacterium]
MLVALVLVTSLVTSLADVFGSVTLTRTLHEIASASVAPLLHPGFAMTLCPVFTAVASTGLTAFGEAVAAALCRLAPAAHWLFAMLLLSRLMVHALAVWFWGEIAVIC